MFLFAKLPLNTKYVVSRQNINSSWRRPAMAESSGIATIISCLGYCKIELTLQTKNNICMYMYACTNIYDAKIILFGIKTIDSHAPKHRVAWVGGSAKKTKNKKTNKQTKKKTNCFYKIQCTDVFLFKFFYMRLHSRSAVVTRVSVVSPSVRCPSIKLVLSETVKRLKRKLSWKGTCAS